MIEMKKSQKDTVRWYQSMLCELPSKPNISLLDLGCGHGYVLAHFLRQGKDTKAYGLDIDSSKLKITGYRNHFVQGDAHHLPFQDNSMDAIIAFELFEHLENPEKALEEVKRVLKRDGTLLFTSPTPKSSTADSPSHINIKTRNEWISLAEDLGFKAKIVTYRYPIRIGLQPDSRIASFLDKTIGLLIGLWKRWVDVTSSKLVLKLNPS